MRKFLVLIILLLPFFSWSQTTRENGFWKDQSSNQVPMDIGSVVELSLPFRKTNPEKIKVDLSKLILRVSTGDVHDFGDKPFDANLSMKIEGIASNGQVVSDLTSWFCGSPSLNVHLSKASTAQSFSKTESTGFSFFVLNSGGPGLNNFYTIERLRVTLNAAPDVTSDGSFSDHIRQVLKISIGYEIGARFDMSGLVVQPDGPNWSTSQRVLERTKYSSFKWKITANPDNVPLDQFELEVLKLRNKIDPALNSKVNRFGCSCKPSTNTGMEAGDFKTGRLIYTNIDWSEALHYKVSNASQVKDLYLSEGSGFYIWRVRALGDFGDVNFQLPEYHSLWSFVDKMDLYSRVPLAITSNSSPGLRYPYPWDCQVFEKAIGNNPNNYWSDLGLIKIHINDIKANPSFPNLNYSGFIDQNIIPFDILYVANVLSSPLQITVDLPYQTRIKEESPIFYFADPDSLLNRGYSRVFSDGNRTKEVEQFANGLDQVRQVQTYIPSSKSILAVGTYFDFSGRSSVETLPMVKFGQNRLNGFISSFLLPNVANDLRPFGARNFDGNATPYPDPARITGTDWDYYGKEYIPDTKGYPYRRITYEKGETDKPIEISGFGLDHMSGAGSHTTKISYSTASQPQMDALFGKEAPNAATIKMVTTEDPNGTSTISYIDLSGKTIATSLGLKDGNNLLPVDNSGIAYSNDVMDHNTSENGSIVSSKRLSFIAPTPLTLTYNFICTPPNIDCYKITPDQKFDLTVRIRKMDDVHFSNQTGTPGYFALPTGSSFAVKDLAGTEFTTLEFEDHNIQCKQVNGIESGTEIPLSNGTNFILPRGSYLIEKILTPQIGGALHVEQASDQVTLQTGPIVNKINAWLDESKCSGDPSTFIGKVRDLAKKFLASDSTGIDDILKTDITYGPRKYGKGKTFQLLPCINDPTDLSCSPQFLFLSTACCNFKIPVAYDQIFDVSTIKLEDLTSDVDDKFSVNPYPLSRKQDTEMFPDFEGYAYEYFRNSCLVDGEGNIDLSIAQKNPDDFDQPTTNPSHNPITRSVADYLDDAPYYHTVKTYIDKGLEHVRMPSLPGSEKERAAIRYIYDMYLRPFMGGYEKAGTFNLMVQHMLTDRLNCDGYQMTPRVGSNGLFVKDGNDNVIMDTLVVVEHPDTIRNICSPLNKKIDCGKEKIIRNSRRDPVTNALLDTNLVSRTYSECIHYSGKDLFSCWTANLNYIKTRFTRCKNQDPAGVSINIPNLPGGGETGPNNADEIPISSTIDQSNDGDRSDLDNHLKNNFPIKGWMAIFMTSKKKKRLMNRIVNSVRNSQSAAPPGGTPPNQTVDPDGIGDCDPSTCEALDLGADEDSPSTPVGPDPCASCLECQDPGPEEKVDTRVVFHLVSEFLNCAGYRFAKVITDEDREPLEQDKIVGYNYANQWDYNPLTTNNALNPNYGKRITGAAFSSVTIVTEIGNGQYLARPTCFDTYDGKNRGYKPDQRWEGGKLVTKVGPTNQVEYINRNLFRNIQDPVYAYKYYEYMYDRFPEIELQNCFRDPDKCISVDASGNRIRESGNPNKFVWVHCNGENTAKPTNYCELGPIQCMGTLENWSCGQRLSYFLTIRDYQRPTNDDLPDFELASRVERSDFLSAGAFVKEVSKTKMKITIGNMSNSLWRRLFPQNLVLGSMEVILRSNLFLPWDLENLSNCTDNGLRRSSFAYPVPGKNYYSGLPAPTDVLDINHRVGSFKLGYRYLFKHHFQVPIGVGQTVRLRSKVELDLDQMNAKVVSACEGGLPAYKNQLREKLISLGYTIGKCVTSCDKNVTDEDLEILAQKMIDACIERGKVNSFAVAPAKECRSMYTSCTIPGNVDIYGNTIKISEVVYGVVDKPEDTPGCNPTVLQSRAPIVPIPSKAGANTEITLAPDQPQPIPYFGYGIWPKYYYKLHKYSADLNDTENNMGDPYLNMSKAHSAAVSEWNTQITTNLVPPPTTNELANCSLKTSLKTKIRTQEMPVYECTSGANYSFLQYERYQEVVRNILNLSEIKLDGTLLNPSSPDDDILNCTDNSTVVCNGCTTTAPVTASSQNVSDETPVESLAIPSALNSNNPTTAPPVQKGPKRYYKFTVRMTPTNLSEIKNAQHQYKY